MLHYRSFDVDGDEGIKKDKKFDKIVKGFVGEGRIITLQCYGGDTWILVWED